MSLYLDFERRIQESDAKEAVEILQGIWDQGINMDRLMASLLEPAATSLQLRFDTPHALICLDSFIQLLHAIPSNDHLYFLQWFARYLSGLPRLFLDFEKTEKIGTLGIRHARKGYARSLLEHKINNAFYYALRFVVDTFNTSLRSWSGISKTHLTTFPGRTWKRWLEESKITQKIH